MTTSPQRHVADLQDPSREHTWRIDMIPWSEKNTEAFAGLHSKGKRLLLIFDEGSAIPDIIWEVAEGALTDANTQIIWLVFGSPTRNIGRFRECFAGGRFPKFWHSTQIDSHCPHHQQSPAPIMDRGLWRIPTSSASAFSASSRALAIWDSSPCRDR